jgi:hypothetical protein
MNLLCSHHQLNLYGIRSKNICALKPPLRNGTNIAMARSSRGRVELIYAGVEFPPDPDAQLA